MSSSDDKPDELAGTEQPFVTHLIELRDRLVRAAIAVAVCFGVLALWPGPSVPARTASVTRSKIVFARNSVVVFFPVNSGTSSRFR